MDYSFNSEIAKMYGVDEAVFIHNLYWWIAKNKANGRHYYDGRNWTYNSVEAFAKLFPFWTVKQIRRIIKKLSDNGAIHVGRFNVSSYDRTQWYSLDETVTCIYQNVSFDLPKRSDDNCPNGQMTSAQMGRPIPDSKPDINTNSKPDAPPLPQKGSEPVELFAEFWKAYPKKEAKPIAQKAFEKLKPGRVLLNAMLAALIMQKQSPQWTKEKGRFIPLPATWLNQRRWEDETEAKEVEEKYGRYV